MSLALKKQNEKIAQSAKMQNQNTAVKNDVTYDKQKNYYGPQWLSIQIKKQKTDDIDEKSAVVFEALKIFKVQNSWIVKQSCNSYS